MNINLFNSIIMVIYVVSRKITIQAMNGRCDPCQAFISLVTESSNLLTFI